MSTQHQHSAKTLFAYLGLFFTLGTVAIALGGVIFQIINNVFPLESYYNYSYSQGAMKASLAALIVGTPFFFGFALMIRKALNKDMIDVNRGPRQWISYIILFIVVAIAVGDFIAVVTSLLNGDLTVRFILKALTVLAISGAIFWFFWAELKSDTALKSSALPKTTLAVAAIVIVAAIVGGLVFVDTPKQTRMKDYDSQRENHLQTLRQAVNDYYAANQELPESLDQLEVYAKRLMDPVTNEPYDYSVISEDEYQLCATFETASDDELTNRNYPLDYEFRHDAGTECFDITPTVSPDSGMIRPTPIR